jgi:hypothetical protein
MITTNDRERLRKEVLDFQNQILDDILLNSIFSVRQPDWFLHARGDHSDINLKTVDFLRGLGGFQFHAVIGRKIPEIFNRKHNGDFEIVLARESNGRSISYRYCSGISCRVKSAILPPWNTIMNRSWISMKTTVWEDCTPGKIGLRWRRLRLLS